MTFGIVSLNAQVVTPMSLPDGVNSKTATPQQFSDAVTQAIKADYANAPTIFEYALACARERGFPDSKDARNLVSASACALTVSVSPEALREILNASLEKQPEFALDVVAAVAATNSRQAGKAATDAPAKMNLGNIRVLKVAGGKVEYVDSTGVLSRLKEGIFVRQGSKILTGTNATVDLVFENGSVVQIKPETEFYIDQFLQAPFAVEGLEFSKVRDEPSRSQIHLSVAEGTIFVDVAKLKKGSRYEVVTPLGSAGIRGTSFYIESQKGGKSAPVSIGVAEGQVQFTATNGVSQPVSQGQAFAVNPTPTGIAFTPGPAGYSNMLAGTIQVSAQIRQSTSGSPFAGVPPAIPAPPTPLEQITPQLRNILQQAEQFSQPILLAVVQKLVQQNPAFAPQVSAAAAYLVPNSALQVALESARLSASQVPQIAAYVSSAVPPQAPAVAAALAGLMPSETLALASSVTRAVPSRATSIAVALVGVVPSQAASVFVTVARIAPSQAVPVAQGVSLVVPSQGDAINAALSEGVGNPGSLNSSGNQIPNQNPGSLNQTSPTPNPSPAPTPDQPMKAVPVSPSA